MPTRDGKLGVGVSGIGWCAAQHIAAFQKNPHVRVTWLHGRDAARTRATLENTRPVSPRRPSDDEVRGPARGAGRRHHLDCDPERPACRASRGRRAGGQAHRPREADRPRRAGARQHPRCGQGGRGADDRVVRAALPPVPEVRALAARVGVARRAAVRAHAVSVARDRLVSRLELGAHARQRPESPPGGRLPRRRRVALVLGARSRSRSARFTRTSPPATSGRRRFSSTRGWRAERSAT